LLDGTTRIIIPPAQLQLRFYVEIIETAKETALSQGEARVGSRQRNQIIGSALHKEARGGVTWC